MKKILLASALLTVSPFTFAHAQDKGPIKLGISGHFKMYGNYTDQDDAGVGVNEVDILRDVDVTFAGETTLDNGLTVGALINADGDAGDSFEVEDSFVYISNTLGRFSLGLEDSASFQLQVAAPSADENIDGLETFINPVNWGATSLAGSNFEASASDLGFDYDNDGTSGFDKITYITPILSGFQAGVSYTPSMTDGSRGGNGNALDDVADEYDDAYDVGARFEHEFSGWTLALGAGYTHINIDDIAPGSDLDDFKEWNTAFNIGIGPVNLGVAYTENNGGSTLPADEKTYVLGADYTFNENYRLGGSYLNRRVEENGAGTTEADRYTGGLVYDMAPGISFRGSVSYVDVDAPSAVSDDVDATSVLLGTQILF